jgi:hypothetical protein
VQGDAREKRLTELHSTLIGLFLHRIAPVSTFPPPLIELLQVIARALGSQNELKENLRKQVKGRAEV